MQIIARCRQIEMQIILEVFNQLSFITIQFFLLALFRY